MRINRMLMLIVGAAVTTAIALFILSRIPRVREVLGLGAPARLMDVAA